MTWEMLQNLYPNDHDNLMKLVALNAIIKTKSKSPKLKISLLLKQHEFIKKIHLRKSATEKPTPRLKTRPLTERQIDREIDKTERQTESTPKPESFVVSSLHYFQTIKECYEWASNVFSFSPASEPKFNNDLYDIWKQYEKVNWTSENGTPIKSQKAIITNAMKYKGHSLKAKVKS